MEQKDKSDAYIRSTRNVNDERCSWNKRKK